MGAMSGFRWVRAKLTLFLRRNADLDQAPSAGASIVKMVKTRLTMNAKRHSASDLSVNNTSRSNTEGVVIGAPVVDTAFESTEKAHRSIGLVAYIVGKLNLARKAVTGFFTNLVAAASTIFGIDRGVRARMNTTLVPVDSVEANGEETVSSGLKAGAIAASSEEGELKRASSLECEISATAAETDEIAVNRSVKTDSEATLVWWIFSEVDENGVLTIKQAYCTTQTDDVLEVI